MSHFRRMGAAMVAVVAAASMALPAAENEPISPQLHSSIDRGLEWLSTKQIEKTGAWEAGLSGSMMPSTAVTSLAVMAFMARGHVPGQGPYGEQLNKGIDYVLSQQKASGVLVTSSTSQSMYDHGIATIMLCEAYGMVDEQRQKKIQDAVAKAVRVILAAQMVRKDPENQGGWRYLPASNDSDISVTGWQLMALRGAANIGAAVPKKAIDDGIAYIKRRALTTGGFSYTLSPEANMARTGTGILSLELLGQHHTKEALAGGDYLMRNPIQAEEKRGPAFHFYAAYYCAQAANQLGGKYWSGINTPIREWLLARQQRNGSWDAGSTNDQHGGDVYASSMAILALTVQYRYLPIYQR